MLALQNKKPDKAKLKKGFDFSERKSAFHFEVR